MPLLPPIKSISSDKHKLQMGLPPIEMEVLWSGWAFYMMFARYRLKRTGDSKHPNPWQTLTVILKKSPSRLFRSTALFAFSVFQIVYQNWKYFESYQDLSRIIFEYRTFKSIPTGLTSFQGQSHWIRSNRKNVNFSRKRSYLYACNSHHLKVFSSSWKWLLIVRTHSTHYVHTHSTQYSLCKQYIEYGIKLANAIIVSCVSVFIINNTVYHFCDTTYFIIIFTVVQNTVQLWV